MNGNSLIGVNDQSGQIGPCKEIHETEAPVFSVRQTGIFTVSSLRECCMGLLIG